MAFYDDIDTTKKWRLGSRKIDVAGNHYVYCSGASSTVAGDWVTIGTGFATARLTTGASGPVGVAMAAVDASTSYGWYQIYGKCTIARASSNGTITSGGGKLQANAIAGTVQDVAGSGASIGAAAGDFIVGAFSYSAQPSASDGTGADILSDVFLNYPVITSHTAFVAS